VLQAVAPSASIPATTIASLFVLIIVVCISMYRRITA
jgi:hypothetical protein